VKKPAPPENGNDLEKCRLGYTFRLKIFGKNLISHFLGWRTKNSNSLQRLAFESGDW
jgi:hypothetical protein